ncbi:hypothetical protein [Agrobacterium rosae]|uniref:Uncharacterized protein n=1 Tax=Agrobacterium rosae TaxID=1972867 RepID=A0A1R3TMR3_9HYPH|nr:hypothetical protein [Agrobacterium rosae]SCX19656.1 hypothetical protein DSM25559_1876 [Agrobacterium rosae]
MFDQDELTVADWLPEGCDRVLIDDAQRRVIIHRRNNQYFKTIEPKTLQAQFDMNAEEAAEFSRNQKLGARQKVASIPTDIYYYLKEEGIADDPERFARWMNDSDNSKFRTNNMTV